MATFSSWLDTYDGGDQLVAGVAQIWRGSKGERPRASAVETITHWLSQHRQVADESLRAAQRAYREDRMGSAPGRQATPQDLAAFKAMNEPPADQPMVAQASLAQPPLNLPAEQLPMVAAIVSALLPHIEAVERTVAALVVWAKAQDERIEPITRLLADLASAEDEADQLDGQEAPQGPPVQPRNDSEWLAGGLWAGIKAPPPDMDALSAMGEPGPEEA